MSSYGLRLPESLKNASKRIAALDNTTMNQFFVVAIAEKISAMETADSFERRSVSASRTKADAVGAKVSNQSPVPGDEWEEN